MINLAPIANVTTGATALGNLILVTPQQTTGYQPQNNPSYVISTTEDLPPSILFNYEGEQIASLESDITDHWTEDNSVVNDQIALKPVLISTHGFVGELNDIAPAVLAPLKRIADKLTVIDAYTPVISETALIAYNEAAFLYSVAQNTIKSAVGAWSSITGDGQNTQNTTSVINGSGINPAANQTKQQIYFQQFWGYWNSRTLFTIQTPWAIFQDMAIKSLRSIQDAETEVITDFEVTFKQMRFATSITDSVSTTSQGKQTRSASQSAPDTKFGSQTPVPAGITQAQAISGVTE